MLQFWNQKIIHVKLHQILHEASPDFQILDDFWVMRVYTQKIGNTPFGAIPGI